MHLAFSESEEAEERRSGRARAGLGKEQRTVSFAPAERGWPSVICPSLRPSVPPSSAAAASVLQSVAGLRDKVVGATTRRSTGRSRSSDSDLEMN